MIARSEMKATHTHRDTRINTGMERSEHELLRNAAEQQQYID